MMRRRVSGKDDFHFSIVMFLNLISWCFVLLRGSFAGPRDQNDPRNHTNGHESEVTMKSEKWKMNRLLMADTLLPIQDTGHEPLSR